MLNVAIKAARAAGAIINRAALDVESVRISQKQINDFVTEVDHASESLRPGHFPSNLNVPLKGRCSGSRSAVACVSG